jgi:predicted DNA-binding ribbon-helix-helix protein
LEANLARFLQVAETTIRRAIGAAVVIHREQVRSLPPFRHISRRGCVLSNSGEGDMKSPVIKRSIVIAGHKTSVSLEDAFWRGLKEIAAARDLTLSDMVSNIDSERKHGNLSSAIRLFVLDHYRTMFVAEAAAQSAHDEMAAQRPAALRA